MERKKVLIVDDDPVFVEALAAVLGQHFEVMTAADGEQAMTRIAEELPDVIVLDIMMSYHSEGYDLANALKRSARTAEVPIIILTGVDKMYEIRSRMETQPVRYERFMTKPPDFQELIRSIRDLAAG